MPRVCSNTDVTLRNTSTAAAGSICLTDYGESETGA
uniref:Uncharacterized protein n=1 Tax=Anguilla anguilla TaxID=7936 RepID=A0A0E9TK95_ANGAN